MEQTTTCFGIEIHSHIISYLKKKKLLLIMTPEVISGVWHTLKIKNNLWKK